MEYIKDFEGLGLNITNGTIQIIDQRLLPIQEVYLTCNTVQDMWGYINTLATRGAPMIGCAAAVALLQFAVVNNTNTPELVQQFLQQCDYLQTSRPTAVNLAYCCDIMAQKSKNEPDYSLQNLSDIAYGLIQAELDMCERMSELGASLVKDGDNILTHCNTGSLATPGIGTALGVIKKAHEQGKKIHVYVDETRPLLQGGRLTTFELHKAGIDYTLISDNMAGMLMKQKKIDIVFVGSDRIAINGDFANKIGTYSVAVLAHYHHVPFYGVAPESTVDFNCACGDDIVIEQRPKEEVLGAMGNIWAPPESNVYNPAFDVSPVEIITGIVLDSGIYTREDLLNGALEKYKSVV
eukprot:TRINITY_DN6116_c0_g1_i1.p1 TRINITY_DN6116_c0_g1~~TRINITY_DN6116_c0_g1_i1.p1  ORF type:complete len:351 (-),score=83.73 TRINITY_DN6116_c0_g1_i1:41-1093(-)